MKTYIYSDKALLTFYKRATDAAKALFGLAQGSLEIGTSRAMSSSRRAPWQFLKRFRVAKRVHAYVQILDQYWTSSWFSCCDSVCQKQKPRWRNRSGNDFVRVRSMPPGCPLQLQHVCNLLAKRRAHLE